MLRFALVGTSGFAESTIAPALLKGPVEFVGVVSRTSERSRDAARQLGVRGYASLDELLADSAVDAVWIGTQDTLHAPIGVACMDAGKHVLVEKPLATSTADGRSLVEAAKRNGVVLRVGFHQRYRPVYQALRATVASGELGKIGFLRLHFHTLMEHALQRSTWRSTIAASGGSWIVKEFGSHLLDLVLWWKGSLGEIAGAVLATHRFQVETDDGAALLLHLEDEAIAIIDVSGGMAGVFQDAVEIYGTDGWVRAHDVFRGNGVVEASSGEPTTYESDDHLEPYLAQLADFELAVAGEPSIGADGEAGLAVLQTIEAAIETARSSPLSSGIART